MIQNNRNNLNDKIVHFGEDIIIDKSWSLGIFSM